MESGPRYWLFDLDNTLYPSSSGLFTAVDNRINLYLKEFLDLELRQADSLRRRYFEKYGLTLVGLMREREVDPAHYLDFVHQIRVEDYLQPNPALRAILRSIAAPKAVFTNGSRQHSLAVLRILGVADIFSEIFDITSRGYIPKPDLRSYQGVLDRLGLSGPEAILVEDLERNLAPARKLGMKTIFVNERIKSAAADYCITSLDELPAILPELSPKSAVRNQGSALSTNTKNN